MAKKNKVMRRLLAAGLVGIVAVAASGCGSVSKSVSYTYSVDTGDSVKITLDTSDGYSMDSGLPFEISVDGEVVGQGTFIEADTYQDYVDAAKSDAQATVIEEDESGGNAYCFWSYADTEYDRAILVGDSDTAILLGNTVSEESARDCFEHLTISVK